METNINLAEVEQLEGVFKYNVLNKRNKLEDWTGSFHTVEQAKAWYEKYGQFHEKQGHKLVFCRNGQPVIPMTIVPVNELSIAN